MSSAKITTKREYRLSIGDFSLLFSTHRTRKIISVELYTDHENKQRVEMITEAPGNG